MPPLHRELIGPAAAGVAVAAALTWAFWPAIATVVTSWVADPENAHGPIVLLISGYFLLGARHRLAAAELRPSLWGLAALVGVGGLYVGTGVIHSSALSQLLVVPAAIAAVWAVFGGAAARAVAPGLGYAVFAVPLHGRLGFLFSAELQTVSTALSTAALQVIGIPAQRDGNVIVLSDTDLGVVEACNGLRMIMSFLAISVAFAAIVVRPAWQRVAVVAGAVPVAVACNVLRIVVTAVVHETAGKKWADLFFHDLAGWLMMPVAFVFLRLELAVTDRLMVPEKDLGMPTLAAAGPGV